MSALYYHDVWWLCLYCITTMFADMEFESEQIFCAEKKGGIAMICPKCGAEADKGKFCPKCGAEMKLDRSEKKSKKKSKRVIRKLSADEIKEGHVADPPTKNLSGFGVDASGANGAENQKITDDTLVLDSGITDNAAVPDPNMSDNTAVSDRPMTEHTTFAGKGIAENTAASDQNMTHHAVLSGQDITEDTIALDQSFTGDKVISGQSVTDNTVVLDQNRIDTNHSDPDSLDSSEMSDDDTSDTSDQNTHVFPDGVHHRDKDAPEKHSGKRRSKYVKVPRSRAARQADDDYDGNIDDASAQAMYKKEHKKTKGKVAAITATVLVILVILAIAAFYLFNWYRGRQLDKFQTACENYAAAMQENDANYGEYTALYEKAVSALNNKDYASFSDLMREMTSLIEKMKDEAGSLQTLEDLKAQYTNELSKFQITEDYQATYDDLMQRLDTAISERAESSVGDLKKEFESLCINLKTSNQQLIQTKLNEINKLDINAADDEVKALFSDYETQVTTAEDSGDYAEALRVLDLWLSSAQQVEQELRQKESLERERLESESRAMESEAAKKSESGSYILEGSDSRYVTEDEILALSSDARKLARNEIYARHGRKFNDATIQSYFDSQGWYNGLVEPEDFDESLLNEYEKANVELIKSLEE